MENGNYRGRKSSYSSKNEEVNTSMSESLKGSDVIEKIEIFIQRLHDMDYVITPEASKLIYETQSTPMEKNNLSSFLANRIYDYDTNRDNKDEIRLMYARSCLIWINRAYTSGVVQEGQGLIKKLDDCGKLNEQLKEELKKRKERCDELEKQIRFLQAIKSPKFIGDVDS